jgi:hypothetical protein
MNELGSDLHAKLKATLQDAFPDARVDDSDVEGFALALQQGLPDLDAQLPDELKQLGIASGGKKLNPLPRALVPGPTDQEGITRTPQVEGDPLRYYWVESRHDRRHPAGYPAFVGKLAMVRATLPRVEPRRFISAIGTLEPADHLIATVHEANDKYARALNYELQRVDIITPPRQFLRFGAVSVMLGYRDARARPTCYILEAGTATGQPKVLYLGRTLDSTVNRRTGYKPTTFSCSDNAYTGQLSLVDDSPSVLQITARDIVGAHSKPAYMAITATFTEQKGPIANVWPGLLIARAALIVAARSLSGLENTCEDT